MLRAALFLLLVSATTAHAQVRGRIFDARSGDAVSGAHVQLSGTLDREFTTTGDGAYAFNGVPAGEYRLVITHPGYDSAAVRVLLGFGRDVVVDIPLTLRPFPVARILVAGARAGAATLPDTDGAIDSLGLAVNGRRASLLGPQSASALADMVAADRIGEPPGDPNGGRPHVLYIWGSSAERGRVLLDGATLNAPLHLGALLPPMDPDLLSAAEFRSGGISPRYDGGTAYIMDFASRPAAVAERRAWGEVDFLAGRIGVAVPAGDHAGIVVGARRVNDEVVDALLGRPFGYSYADALIRADAPLRQAGLPGHVQGTVFVTREAVAIPRDLDHDEAAWRNFAASLTWSDRAGDASRATARATFSRGVADLPLLSAPGGHVEAGMDRLAAAAERRWNRGNAGGGFGVEYEYLRFRRYGSADADPALPALDGPVACTPSLPCFATDAHAVSAFGEAGWQPATGVSARAGARLRVDPRAGAVELLPRVSVTSMLNQVTAVTLSAGRFSQTYTAVRDVPGGAAGVDEDIHAAVAHANHVELNVVRRAGSSAINAGVYLRHHEDAQELPARVIPGLDVSWAYIRDGAALTLGYSLTSGPEGFAGRARAVHQLAGIGVGARRGPMHFSVSTAYGNGMPLTSIVLERPADGAGPMFTDNFGTNAGSSLHSSRSATAGARTYVRVDAAFGAEWRLRWSGREMAIVPYGRIVNAFSQRDALFYYHEAGSPGEPRPLGAVPAIPVLGVRWQF